jgi:hypothetical protein
VANRRQAQELRILKSHRKQTLQARYLADQRPMSLYRFIDQHRLHYPVRRLYQVLGVALSR